MTTGTQCVSWDADRSCLAGFFNDRSDLFWHYLTSSLERYLPTPQGCMYILMNLTNFVKFISTTFASLVFGQQYLSFAANHRDIHHTANV